MLVDQSCTGNGELADMLKVIDQLDASKKEEVIFLSLEVFLSRRDAGNGIAI